jgi:hypothetical protein
MEIGNVGCKASSTQTGMLSIEVIFNEVFSWPAIGTNESQWMEIVLKNGEKYRYQIPAGSYLTPEGLESGLHNGILKQLVNKFSHKNEPSIVRSKRAAATVGSAADDKPQAKSFKGPPENIQTDWKIEPNPRIAETTNASLAAEPETIIKASLAKSTTGSAEPQHSKPDKKKDNVPPAPKVTDKPPATPPLKTTPSLPAAVPLQKMIC